MSTYPKVVDAPQKEGWARETRHPLWLTENRKSAVIPTGRAVLLAVGAPAEPIRGKANLRSDPYAKGWSRLAVPVAPAIPQRPCARPRGPSWMRPAQTPLVCGTRAAVSSMAQCIRP